MKTTVSQIRSQQKTPTELAEEINSALENLSAADRIGWLAQQFPGELLLSTSLGLQAAVMLDLVTRSAPEVPIVFIDTGYHFTETYHYLDQLEEKIGFDLEVYNPKLTAARQEAKWGKLWEQGQEGHTRYHLINKIEPMDRALKDHGASIWLSGLRRSQASSRSDRAFAEAQNGTIKVYPILDWSDQEVEQYFASRDLPRHPLQKAGYVTMGDWHSTKKPVNGENREETRFDGSRYECGLHLESGNNDFQI